MNDFEDISRSVSTSTHFIDTSSPNSTPGDLKYTYSSKITSNYIEDVSASNSTSNVFEDTSTSKSISNDSEETSGSSSITGEPSFAPFNRSPILVLPENNVTSVTEQPAEVPKTEPRENFDGYVTTSNPINHFGVSESTNIKNIVTAVNDFTGLLPPTTSKNCQARIQSKMALPSAILLIGKFIRMGKCFRRIFG